MICVFYTWVKAEVGSPVGRFVRRVVHKDPTPIELRDLEVKKNL